MPEIARISADSSSVIMRVSPDSFAYLRGGTAELVFTTSLKAARDLEMTRWQIPTSDDRQSRAAALDVLSSVARELSIVELADTGKRVRTSRVPKQVRESAKLGLQKLAMSGLSSTYSSLANTLANSDSVTTKTLARVVYAQGKLDSLSSLQLRPNDDWNRSQLDFALAGGSTAMAWAKKTLKASNAVLTASAFVFDESLTYFAGGDEENTTQVDTLYVLDSLGSWSVRMGTEFVPSPEPDRELLIELDEESASTLAEWLDDRSPDRGHVFELRSIHPAEANMVELALSSLDTVTLDRAYQAVLAAGYVDDDYTPQERSQNAKRQQRAAGGRFGGGAAAPVEAKEQLVGLARARLPQSLPLVPNIAALLDAYLARVEELRPTTAAATPVEKVVVDPAESEIRPLYVAIVDDVDNDAVLEVVAIVPAPQTGGEATAWKRRGQTWQAAPELLADMRGATPPSVVELNTDELVKSVLGQVDQADAAGDHQNTDTKSVTPVEPVAASGYDLYGPTGELIAIYAAGVPGVADTASDHAAVARLKTYWTVGVGGTVKIRWSTPGDWTRCYRNLRKYMGTRAKGYCSILHHDMTGTWPGSKNNIGKRS